jgi:hypothetical protein
MHAWNSDFIRQNWKAQSAGHLIEVDGKTALQATNVAIAYRDLVAEEGNEASEDTLHKAIEIARSGKIDSPFPFQGACRGVFMQQLSEVGATKELNDLLEFADVKLNPTWERGGLFYPRADQVLNSAGEYVHVDPHSGNSGMAYSRLNVENGQKIMWEKPWTREQLRSRPRVEGVTLADGVDFLRGEWIEKDQAVVVTLKAWESELKQRKVVSLSVEGLAAGEWAAYVNGELQKTHNTDRGGKMNISVSMAASEEVDVVVWRVVA